MHSRSDLGEVILSSQSQLLFTKTEMPGNAAQSCTDVDANDWRAKQYNTSNTRNLDAFIKSAGASLQSGFSVGSQNHFSPSKQKIGGDYFATRQWRR